MNLLICVHDSSLVEIGIVIDDEENQVGKDEVDFNDNIEINEGNEIISTV